ncbi:DUF4760 domain-containing protein [Longimicrobium sp.]|uniref:DUF4760 domain-containing protein n=1 Tax=Longimicrobium sp. TaxID=2029185 RepID=UPI002C0DA610|nr:hypothetical protein [Longimicrobium sp.]HSU12689.1 hypothetical protein [Longimicrobium sp.]
MTEAQGGAQLILKLYELRREDELRRARDWFASQFFPQSPEEVLAAWVGPESARYRMVTTYWEMAATLVNHGAIPEDMFHDANTEHVAIYLKLQPHLPRLREMTKYPSYMTQLERMVGRMPDLDERAAPMRAYLERKRRELAGIEAAQPPASAPAASE